MDALSMAAAKLGARPANINWLVDGVAIPSTLVEVSLGLRHAALEAFEITLLHRSFRFRFSSLAAPLAALFWRTVKFAGGVPIAQ